MADFLDENIKTLMELTGLDLEGAQRVFKYRDNNLDSAINYILDGNEVPDDVQMNTTDLTGPSTSYKNPGEKDMPTLNIDDDDEDNVRAPIPPKRETMILPEEDNFRFRAARVATHNICPLRNFEREGELLEEELFANERVSSRSSRRKRFRLEDIFRPPIDLCYYGTFQSARDYASEKNRWLIVNVQEHTEFLSQCLNRDIWSNANLKNIIREFFTFWQVSSDNLEGARFKTFYAVESCPHVGIIDPRTGEQKISLKNIEMKPEKFLKDFYMFLKENGPHPNSQDIKKLNGYYNIKFKDTNGCNIPMDDSTNLENLTSSTSGTSTSTSTVVSVDMPLNDLNSQPSTSSGSTNNIIKQNGSSNIQLEKLTEEEQIELAIKKSLNEASTKTPTKKSSTATGTNNNNDDSDEDNEDVEEFSDEEIQLTNDNNLNYEKYLGSSLDPITKLQLRLPNDCRELLEWPSTSKIRAIKLYLNLKYPELTQGQYKILNISTFPKRNLMELSDELTFDKCDLHPVCILYIHPDD